MAERIEEAEAEPGADIGPISPAAAIAIGVRKGRSRDRADPEFDAFLRDQRKLINLQAEHLHEQRGIILSRLRLGRFSDRMKALLQVMTAAVGLGVAVAVGGMAWSASQERGLVIEPFSVSPDMAARGLTGQVVASMLLDDLGRMQSATTSMRAPSTYANNWNDEIKVEIPETGVSIGELRRLLVHWFGHQTSISGEVYRTPMGLALAARTGTAPAEEHAGAEADLATLIQAAAEDVYGQTQPYRYAVYLSEKGDAASAARSNALLHTLALNGSRIDRLWADVGLANSFLGSGDGPGDWAGAMSADDDAIALDPHFPNLYANRSNLWSNQGRDEASYLDDLAYNRALRRYGRRYLTPVARNVALAYSQVMLAMDFGDYRAAVANAARTAQAPGMTVAEPEIIYLVLGHDLARARNAIAKVDARSPSHSPAWTDDRISLQTQKARLAGALDDWAEERRLLAAIDTVRPASDPRSLWWWRSVTSFLAVATARDGDVAAAEALVAPLPTDCYSCLRARAEVAAAKRDWPAMNRWYAEAAPPDPVLALRVLRLGPGAAGRGRPRRRHRRAEDRPLQGPALRRSAGGPGARR